ncbi:MAG: FAD:protein FMN transferase, partial [Planctomycetota bacterium]|nr:FAD:protein FMN transferase [Planctomycetota bacterium]
MHTRFEVVTAGEDADYAAKVAANAFDELDRLEQQLSRFIPGSDIARISALKAGESVRVGEAAFECLRLAAQVWQETGGAFDATVGALMDFWRDTSEPRAEERWAVARARMGMERLELNERDYAVTVKGGPVSLDLGAIGKGYAVDRMATLLREWGIPSAVVHGGTSSVYALDPPPGLDGWPLTLANPRQPSECLRRVLLRHRSL